MDRNKCWELSNSFRASGKKRLLATQLVLYDQSDFQNFLMMFDSICLFRATFGQNVGPFRKQVGTGVEFYFEGMSPKNSTVATSSSSQTISAAPSPPNATAPNPLEVPGSPILKAQLCAPPKVNHRKEAPKQVCLVYIGLTMFVLSSIINFSKSFLF